MQNHWSQILVPRFILNHLANRQFSGQFSAASLFVDISGFTALTETLLQEGAVGAETLANTVQAVFDPLIEQIYTFGGFISGFAGDAFYALFPGEHFQACQNAVNAASGIRRHLLANPLQETPFGTFRFEIKMGVAFGEVDWAIVEPEPGDGYERVAAYYFRGSAIEESTVAENMARPSEIIISMQVLQILRATVTIETIGSPSFFRIRALKFPSRPTRGGQAAIPPTSGLASEEGEADAVDPALVNRFIPSAIRHQTVRGEFRQVVSLMVNVPEPNLPGRIDEVIRTVFALQAQYGGYLNGVLFGDKGCHLLLYWGTPTTYENDVERALQFALALQQGLSFAIRGGITYQFMYAGFVGAALQTNYACYGRGVNLASRCMEAAPWDQIWVEEQVARARPPFELEWVGHLQFKGFEDELPVFRLSRRHAPSQIFYGGELIGRELELGQLVASLQPIFERRFAGVTLIEGEAGLGKTRLVYTAQHRLEEARFLIFPCEQAQSQPLAPIRTFLRKYFQFIADSPTNETRFMAHLRALIGTGNLPLQSDLSLTYSCLGALVGLHWPGSHYEQLDPPGRFQNTLLGLKALLKTESLRQPLVIVVEDAQWLDEDSRKFFDYLTRNVETFPLGLVITTRTGENPLNILPTRRISLAPLTLPGLRQLAKETLRQPATPELIAFLFTRAEGNPFFAEQILLYLEENDLLIPTEDGLAPSDEIDPEILPVDVRAILTARLDSLTGEVKTVVQTASILGREFEILVLAQMMREDSNLLEKVEEASKASIWSALNQLHYLFKHALLRDTAYNMQLLSRRQELHTLAAQSLEHLQTAGITVQAGEIAYHYEQANLPHLALPYFVQAGDAAAYTYQNALALNHYQRALALTPLPDVAGQFRIWQAMEKVYDLEGKRELQKIACDTLQALAKKLRDPFSQAEAALRYAFYYRAINDYPATIKAAERCILLSANRYPNQEASAHVRIGHALWLQGRYDESKTRLEQAQKLTQAKGFTDQKLVAEIWRNLGVVLWFLQAFDAAEAQYKRALAYCREAETRDMRGEAACLNNLGTLAHTSERFEQAVGFYQQAIEVYQKAGDRQGEGNTLANLGGFAANRGDFPLAIETFQRVFSLALETGDRHGQGHAQNHLGQIAMNLGQYDAAHEYYDRAFRIYQEINDSRGIGHIYLNRSHLALRENQPGTALQFAEATLAHVQKWRDPPTEGSAWLVVGQAQAHRERVSLASEAYHHAARIFSELKAHNALMETFAAEACLYLAQKQLPLALEKIAPVIQLLDPVLANPQRADNHQLFGTKHPFEVYWRCYQVFSAAQDLRAEQVLTAARLLLQKVANRIQDDVLWRSYLERVEVHAEIMGQK
ncbi:MAG: tetratricopeptide repeat protein [Anaerolineales bacterium]|nr:tetratricopeptide repeat protein [Anaerolineales bacterium]